jgi:CBS domain-containing protein
MKSAKNGKLVKDVMTDMLKTCTADTKLADVAKMMVEYDVGAIPVLFNNRPIGIITDRDIVVRTLAIGRNPLEYTAEQCMTANIITVTPETSLEECLDLMEKHQVRRMVVINNAKECCGIVAQADIALKVTDNNKAGEVVEKISRP